MHDAQVRVLRDADDEGGRRVPRAQRPSATGSEVHAGDQEGDDVVTASTIAWWFVWAFVAWLVWLLPLGLYLLIDRMQ
jgi:hypothetical protein